MREFNVHLGLKNGQVFNFIVRANSREEIVGEIKKTTGSRYYRFVTEDYVKYQVLRTEIVSFGIGMNREEIEQYENSLR